MNETEFRQELKKGLSGVYFFYGEEEYLKKFYSTRVRLQTVGDDADTASWNVYDIEGKKGKKESAALDSLQEAINAVPMMGERVFVRYNADFSAFTEDETEELISLIKSVDSSQTVLILNAAMDCFDPGILPKRPSPAYKKYSAVCQMVDFCRMNGTELRRWIMRRLAKEGITIEPMAADSLINRSGTSMFMLSGELDKLSAYALGNNMSVITAQTVAEVSDINEEEEAFALANAIMNGDRRAALKALHRCKTAREEPYAVLGMVSKSLCEMLTVCCLMEDGADKKEISSKMKMHEYRTGLMMNSVRNVKPEQLIATLGRCREADIVMKGAVPGYIAIERFICTIPTQRKRAVIS